MHTYVQSRLRNRSGTMLNANNCHRNGSMIWRASANLAELHTAVCFEMSTDKNYRQDPRILLDVKHSLLLVVGANDRLA